MTGFGDSYGCSAYGSGAYNSSAVCGASTSSGSGAASGTLTNTGIAVSLIVGVASLLLLVAILVRFWRRPARVVAAEPAAAEEPASRQQR
ncbi:MAG TPA: hypothetical protein VLF71_05885 [Candidatus Saccharimonadales bacterium]|nr:hypothetical protein [Candidatus Saccharimonadales bacterium]